MVLLRAPRKVDQTDFQMALQKEEMKALQKEEMKALQTALQSE
jgi:hypothetical protein